MRCLASNILNIFLSLLANLWKTSQYSLWTYLQDHHGWAVWDLQRYQRIALDVVPSRHTQFLEACQERVTDMTGMVRGLHAVLSIATYNLARMFHQTQTLDSKTALRNSNFCSQTGPPAMTVARSVPLGTIRIWPMLK